MYRLEIWSSLFSTYRLAACSFADPARRGFVRGCGKLDEMELTEVVLGEGEGRESGKKPPDSERSMIFTIYMGFPILDEVKCLGSLDYIKSRRFLCHFRDFESKLCTE